MLNLLMKAAGGAVILVSTILVWQEVTATSAVGPWSIARHLPFGMKKLAATSIVLSTSLSPFGNVGSALQSIIDNPEAITCVLDTQQGDENHGSCQLLNSIVRVRAGKLLTIKQDWGRSASTGAAVWNGANMAAWYLENTLGREKVKGTSILELGAGVGFTSLVAQALGAKEVVVTDGNMDVLKLAVENIALNVPEDEQGTIKTAQLRWNTEDEQSFIENRSQPWDYIIAADVTYLKKNRPELIASIAKLAGPNTIALISMEPRNIGEVEDVLEIAEKNGFRWKEEKLPIEKDKELCNLLCARMFALTKIEPSPPSSPAIIN